MNNRRKLNWGILGAGIIARTMAAALHQTTDNHLYAVASKTPERARRFAQENNIERAYDYEALVNDPEIDIIYVATTHNFHFENAKLALKHGKHVLIEKPFTVNAREAKELVRLARANNLFLMEAIWTRFLPDMKLLKKKIENHDIGKIAQINISCGKFVPPQYEQRLNDPALAGGVTLDMGIYAISFVCYILGEIPEKTKSVANINHSGVDELANYLFQFPSGCLANISMSHSLYMKNEACIYGSKGYIHFPGFPVGKQFTVHHHHGTNDIQDSTDFHEQRFEHGFLYQVEEAAHCIHAGEFESKIIPLDETIAIMEIMDKMRMDWGLVYPFE